MDRHEVETSAMRRALDLAATPDAPRGPNPRVGCVLLSPTGEPLAEGLHRGRGTPHAEAAALATAGDRARGATAVVTLEPCAHTGRTGPCATALVDAGVARVVFAQADTSRKATGGAELLRAAGIDVESGLLETEARSLNPVWTFSAEHGRPFVTWKLAVTLDGRSAAADGTSRWVSSEAARRDTQRLRAECDAILVGTGTVLVDDPRLTARDEQDRDLPRENQLLRVVMGLRPIPGNRHVRDDAAETLMLATHDPHEALAALAGRSHVLLEGGPTLAAAFLRADLVDEVVAYVAPMLLGAGLDAVGDLGVTTMSEALTLRLLDARTVGEGDDANLRLVLTPRKAA